MILKIDASNFEDLIAALDSIIPEFERKDISTKDVTEEYIDVKTRIETKKRYEARYIDFMSKANNVEELMLVENDLRRLREEIEAKEGRLRVLDDQITWSTVYLNIRQEKERKIELAEVPGFFSQMGAGFSSGWQGILDFIVHLSYVWPWLLLLGGGAYWLRRKVLIKKA